MSSSCPNCRNDHLVEDGNKCEICGSENFSWLGFLPVGWLYPREIEVFKKRALILVAGAIVLLLIIIAPIFTFIGLPA